MKIWFEQFSMVKSDNCIETNTRWFCVDNCWRYCSVWLLVFFSRVILKLPWNYVITTILMWFCFKFKNSRGSIFLIDSENRFFDVIRAKITCSNATIETLEKGVKYVFIVNFEHISHLFLVFLLLTLNKSVLHGIRFSSVIKWIIYVTV